MGKDSNVMFLQSTHQPKWKEGGKDREIKD